MLHHQLSTSCLLKPGFSLFPFLSEKADLTPMPPPGLPLTRRGTLCLSLTRLDRANGHPLSSPRVEGFAWVQNTELHAEVKGARPQRRPALSSPDYRLWVSSTTCQCDKNCPFSIPILPLTLCSLAKSLPLKTWFPASKMLILSRDNSQGPICPTLSCFCLTPESAHRERAGDAYLQVTKPCVYFG